MNAKWNTSLEPTGPEEYGFGNGRNYDLNRFYKNRTPKKICSFQELFVNINPEVFIDNHSNGADVGYTLHALQRNTNVWEQAWELF
jgi:hypothetical protein